MTGIRFTLLTQPSSPSRSGRWVCMRPRAEREACEPTSSRPRVFAAPHRCIYGERDTGPVTTKANADVAQLAERRPFQVGGHRFEPCRPLFRYGAHLSGEKVAVCHGHRFSSRSWPPNSSLVTIVLLAGGHRICPTVAVVSHLRGCGAFRGEVSSPLPAVAWRARSCPGR
jgi:hypothetical protein